MPSRSRLRRIALVAVVPLVLGACASESFDSSSSTTASESETTIDTLPLEPVDGPAEDEPAVKIPAKLPTKLMVKDLEKGKGAAAKNGDTVFVHYVGVRSEDGTRFDGNFGGSPFPVTLGRGSVIKGWEEGLVGATAGSLRQLDIPADLAYGDAGAGETIKPGDALSFVIRTLAVVPATTASDAPKVSITAGEIYTKTTTKDLVVGDGAEAKKGGVAVVHLIAYRADTGEELERTWGVEPFTSTLTDGQSVPGFIDGIPGMKVGGRRQIGIPYGRAFGDEGNDQLGLPAKTDLVVVIDLLAAF